MPSQSFARIDWRKLSAIEVNSFESELHSNRWSVSEIGSMIAYSYIDSEFDLHSVDSNFVKLFKLSQIVIAFLLEKYYNQHDELKEQVDQASDTVQENRKLRKLLEIYKKAFTFGGSMRQSITLDLNDESDDKSPYRFQCPDCPKAFGNSMYLQSHIYRRHPENSIISKGLLPLTHRINQYNSTLLQSTAVDEVKKELENLKYQLQKTEDQLAEEKESREALQIRLDSEVEKKIEQLTSLLKLSCESERSTLTSHQKFDDSSKPLMKDETQGIIEIDSDSHSDDLKGTEDQSSPSKPIPSNVDETQNLTGLLMVHTQEVRNLGNRLEKLVDKLWLTDSLSNQDNFAQKSIPKVSPNQKAEPLEDDNGPKIVPSSQPSLKNKEMKDEDEEDLHKNQGHQVLSYLDRYMEALGIQDKSCIGTDEFVDAMKVIKERRRRIGFQDKVNSLKDALDYELRTRKIRKTFNQMSEESIRMQNGSNNQRFTSSSDSSRSPWVIAKSGLEQTSAKNEEKPNRVRFGEITIQELGELNNKEKKIEKGIKKIWTKPKSVLIKRDAQGNRIGHVGNRPKRRISFSEKRIEISPEYSSDDDDFDQMMAGEIKTGTIEITGKESLEESSESAEHDEVDIYLDNNSRILPYSQSAKQQQTQLDPIPPPPKPRTSKALGLNDHISTADLKWFDSDGSDENEKDNHDKHIPDRLKKLTQNSGDNVSMTIGVDQGDNRVSVTELTKIIEEQLHNRQANNKTNLTNSVDTMTGKGKNTTTGYGVRAIGTLNYDSDSD